MCKIYSCVVVFCLAGTVCHGLALNPEDEVWRIRREIPDECRPFPPPSHHHHAHHGPDDNKRPPICCELPDIMPVEQEAFEKCHELVIGSGHQRAHGAHKHGHRKNTKRSSNEENQGDNSKENDSSPPPPPPPGVFQERKECYFNCAFNQSGLLTGDGLLNEDMLNQKLLQTAANNTKWASTLDPVYKKCVAAAKEANSQSQKACKQGAAEYLKCMSRELFFNCPSDLWVNSAECNEFKNKLEKCPNLWAPNPHAPPRHHHHGHHHHHEHRHHEHRENHE